MDYYSRNILCDIVPNTLSSTTIRKLEDWFCMFGIPHSIRSDNGPQFVGEAFNQFLGKWRIEHTTSSPRYPQSNGEVERAVQTVKALLKKNVNLQAALCFYRDAPLANGYSPAQLLFNRSLHSMGFSSNQTIDVSRLRQSEEVYRRKMAEAYNHRCRVQSGTNYIVGQSVELPREGNTGVVIGGKRQRIGYSWEK